jgi:hypothetical protein
MPTSKTSHKIKQREHPKDIFLTPLKLAKSHIDMIEFKDDEIWYDPFKNTGNYYNQYPNDNKKWSEIIDGKDFFAFNEKVDIICSNPPYSMIDAVLKKSITLNPRIISYLIGVNNLTPRRIEYMEKAGYFITKLHLLKVYEWYGMNYIVEWEKDGKPIINYDRVVWRTDK